MDADFINVIRGNIYVAKANGIIPWAAIQRPAKWVGGDPNPGKAIGIDEQGNFTVEPGYYYYKQVSGAGQPGMLVAHVVSNDQELGLIAFAKGTTANPDAFVVVNTSGAPKEASIELKGTSATSWEAYRTGGQEMYASLGLKTATNGVISYTAPARSVTTFYAK
jgi:hypothetical protein